MTHLHISPSDHSCIRSALGCLGREWNRNGARRGAADRANKACPGRQRRWERESRAQLAGGYSALSGISPGASTVTPDLQSCNGALT